MRSIRIALLTLVLAVLFGGNVYAEKRVALVIGNSAYQNISALRNPKNDAELMSSTLSDLGFEVVVALDADRRTMGRAIRKFGRTLRDAGKDAVGLFYYAGHGVQARGANYLIPIGSIIEDHADLDIEAVGVGDVLSQMKSAGNAFNLVILDACRNNPFKSEFRDAARGLARLQAATGTFISFSAAPGQVAKDGDGRHSPFLTALVDTMQEPGLPVEQVFKRVRVKVEKETDGAQTPWEESSMRGDFYFTNKEETPQTPLVDNSLELEFWNAIQESRDISAFRAYLEQYPDGLFVELAGQIIERLEAARKAAQERERALETAYWNSVKDSKNPAHIQVYLNRFPNGRFSTLAELMIERLGGTVQKAEVKPVEPVVKRNTRTAALQPQEAARSAEEAEEDPDLPRKIQTELARVGCAPGTIDGRWGQKSQSALDLFMRSAELTAPDESISSDTLRLLQEQKGRVCPLTCGRGQVLKNNVCVSAKPYRPQAVTRQPVQRQQNPSRPRRLGPVPSDTNCKKWGSEATCIE